MTTKTQPVIETGMYWKYQWAKYLDQNDVGVKTCLVQVRDPGLPDKFIRITPATDTFELVDTTNTPGVERLAVIDNIIKLNCPRQQALPQWVRFHTNHPKDSSNPDLGLDDVQTAALEGGIVFEVVCPDKRPVQIPQATREQAMDKRMGQVENVLGALSQTMASLSKAVDVLIDRAVVPTTTQVEEPVKRGPGRPRKE